VGNWTGTGSIDGSGDAERLALDVGEYMVSETVNTGAELVALSLNVYAAGDAVTIYYRTGATQVACEGAAWIAYSGAFASTGYVQIKLESTTPAFQPDYTIDIDVTTADGDGNYAAVQPGDIVGIVAGTRDKLVLQDFHGTVGNPITFINYGGLVNIASTDWVGLYVRRCSYVRITGTGDAGYTYGIKVSDSTNLGITLEEGSTNFEVDYVEVTGTNGPGIQAKTEASATYNRTNFTQYDTYLHHNWVHDLVKEGLYVGSSSYSTPTGGYYPSVLDGVDISYNLVENTGWDGIQVGSNTVDGVIHHNTILNNSTSHTLNQCSGMMINRGSVTDIRHNAIIDGTAYGIYVQGNGGNHIFNNLIVRSGEAATSHSEGSGLYISLGSNETEASYYLWNNTIIQPGGATGMGYGVRFRPNVGASELRNTIIADPAGAYVYLDGDSILTQSNNLLVPTIAEVGFTNPATDDYSLTVSATGAIDLGYDLSSSGVVDDYIGTARPQGAAYDIGAYEYVA